MKKYSKKEQAKHLKEWTAALRSGKYSQGKNALRAGDNYCCLGVACDLIAQAGEGEWVDRLAHKHGFKLRGGAISNLSVSLPPDGAMEGYFGVYREGRPKEAYGFDLPALNDGDPGRSFDYIADYIDAGRLRKV